MKRGKKYRKMQENFEDKEYPLSKAIKVAKNSSYTKFTGSMELHLAMKTPKDKDPKSIKGSFSLPNPVQTNDDIKIVVFCPKEDVEAAKKAGAVEAGLEDLVKKIQDGWSDFDMVLAVPQVMGQIAVLGKQLGPKGLMPNPKTGTLVDSVDDIAKTIEEFKKGKTNFACDETGVVHLVVGKTDTDDEKIAENVRFAIEQVAEVVGKNPESLYKSIFLSPTMGAGVKVGEY